MKKQKIAIAAVVTLLCVAVRGYAADPPSLKPEEITLAGKLIRPVKWSPQLQLVPAGQLQTFDLRGTRLKDIPAGAYIRVHGVVRSFLHRGSVAGNPSPFPPQWTVYLHVNRVERLDGPQDILKPAVVRPATPIGSE